MASSILHDDTFQCVHHDSYYELLLDNPSTLYVHYHWKIISVHFSNGRDITLMPLLGCISFSGVPLVRPLEVPMTLYWVLASYNPFCFWEILQLANQFWGSHILEMA